MVSLALLFGVMASQRPAAAFSPSYLIAQVDDSRLSVQRDGGRQDTRQRADLQVSKDREQLPGAEGKSTSERAPSGESPSQDVSRIDRAQASREPPKTR